MRHPCKSHSLHPDRLLPVLHVQRHTRPHISVKGASPLICPYLSLISQACEYRTRHLRAWLPWHAWVEPFFGCGYASESELAFREEPG